MRYELVIQWPTTSLSDYDATIGVENTLVEHLSEAHDVDGHDIGLGVMNVFVHTNSPKKAFQEIKDILGSRDFWVDAKVAYRKVSNNEFTVLWPPHTTEFSV